MTTTTVVAVKRETDGRVLKFRACLFEKGTLMDY